MYLRITRGSVDPSAPIDDALTQAVLDALAQLPGHDHATRGSTAPVGGW
jgi:hypothetical protein